MAKTKVENVALFNQIRQACSTTFQERIPEASNSNIQQISKDIMTGAQFKSYLNEFLETMINKVAFTIFRSAGMNNMFSEFIYYNIGVGDIIEEVGVQPATAEDFKVNLEDDSTNDPYRVTKPHVITNYYKNENSRKYRVTLTKYQIQKAFNNESGLSSLINYIVGSLLEGCTVDEYLMFKEVLNAFIMTDVDTLPKNECQKLTLKSAIIDKETSVDFINTTKNLLLQLEKPSKKYNASGFMKMQKLGETIIFLREDVTNFIQSYVLANAYNRGDLGLNPDNSRTGEARIFNVDDFGGELPCYTDDAGVTYKLLFKVYNQHGKFTHFSETKGGAKTTKEIVMIPNYRFTSQPTATTGAAIERDIVAIICENTLPLIAIREDNFSTKLNEEYMYVNNTLSRFYEYGYSAMANAVIIYEPSKTIKK